jgi:hypothetical protein
MLFDCGYPVLSWPTRTPARRWRELRPTARNCAVIFLPIESIQFLGLRL